jgi:DNA-binding transcriptional MerR regulator
MKYKIGEMSKILNIPIDTIRYFEKEGIISPCVSENNNYRYYSEWDMAELLSYKFFRSLDFSMSESKNIQQTADLRDFSDKMNERLAYFHERKLFYASLEECYAQRIKAIYSIPQHLDKISIREMEIVDYFIYQRNSDFDKSDQVKNLYVSWIKYSPFIRKIIRVTQKNVEKKIYELGFAVTPKWADSLKLERNEHVKRTHPYNAVYTVVKTWAKSGFLPSSLIPVFDYIKRERLTIRDDIVGFILARVREPDDYAEYIEFYIPV